jgi:uncharacterized protein YggU (UPF0235/DUF167 family)
MSDAGRPHDRVPWRPHPSGIALRVRATPKAAKPGVGGIETTPEGLALAVKVRAAPDKGAANAAVEAAVAEWLGVPRSHVRLAAGPRSRVKMLAIAGDSAQLVARLCRGLSAGENDD